MNKIRISDFTLEKYLMKEMPESQYNELKLIVESDDELLIRIEQLKKSNEEILTDYTPEFIAPQIKRKINIKNIEKRKYSKSLIKKLALPSFGLGAAAIIIITVLPLNQKDVIIDNNTGEITRIKGMKPGLEIYRKTSSKIESLKNGSSVMKSDLLQISYISPEPYGLIISIDGRGAVTIHHPPDEKKSLKLKVNRKVILPMSYELDDAPDYERFFLITSDSEFNIQNIINAAEKLASDQKRAYIDNLNINNNINQYSITLKKGRN